MEWLPALVALSGALVTLTGILLARRQNRATAVKTEAEGAQILKDTALDLVAPLRDEINRMKGEVTELRGELAEVRGELSDARDELAQERSRSTAARLLLEQHGIPFPPITEGHSPP